MKTMSLLKLQKILFYLILFLIPSNLAKHWPQNWSYVSGILVDYLIPSLYLTDVLIVLLLLFWLIEKIKNQKLFALLKKKKQKKKFLLFTICYLLFAIYYLLFAANKPAFIYKLLKITEFIFFGFWIYKNSFLLTVKKISLVLSLSVIWQSVLAICQWLKQASIFGYLFFGEQPYSSATLGIKKINFFGQIKIPPLGTFPHPNVLAGFLSLSLSLIIFLYFTHDRERNIEKKTGSLIPWPIILPSLTLSSSLILISSNLILIKILAVILGAVALFLTFSLPSWAVFLFTLFYFSFPALKRKLIYFKHDRVPSRLKNKTKKHLLITHYYLLFTICCLLFAVIIFLSFKIIEPSSLIRRQQLNKIAVKMWLNHPILGVGLNNFIVSMEKFGQVTANYRFLQPVHNVYLLILAETGIIGIIGLIGLIWLIRKRVNYCLLFLIFFDHYFFTLQQGMLIATFILGLASASSSTSPTASAAARKTARRANS